MDRRGSRRKRVRLRVRVDPGGMSTTTGDVGPGGIFVYAARVHRPGTRIRLVVRLPDGSVAEAEAEVRWARRVPPGLVAHARGGMGLAFLKLDPGLARYLAEHFPALRVPA